MHEYINESADVVHTHSSHLVSLNPHSLLAGIEIIMKDTSHSMHAAVFRGPYNVAVETRPRPILLEATDAVVKVQRAAVCGRYSSIRDMASQDPVLISRP